METAGDFIPPFAHRPLPDYHIRVVHILPSKQPGAPIECRIAVHSNQLERPEYDALSYAWGDPQDGERTILVDGLPFAIRLNLWLFLQQLRRDCSVRVVWADAICIDQSNTEERNHQVKLMGDIYRHADRTLIWLGPSDQDSDQLITTIEELLNPHLEFYYDVKFHIENGTKTSIREYHWLQTIVERKEVNSESELKAWYRKALGPLSPISTRSPDLQAHPENRGKTSSGGFGMTNDLNLAPSAPSLATNFQFWVDTEYLALMYAEVLINPLSCIFNLRSIRYTLMQTWQDSIDNHPFLLRALSDLSTRPYWKRLWIVQEIILSHRIKLFCGSKIFSWNALAFMLRSCEFSNHENGRIVAASNASVLNREWHIRHEKMALDDISDSARSRTLESILDAFQSSLCSDIRDKIFGLLALIEDAPLEPDYSKTPIELFSELMAHFSFKIQQEVPKARMISGVLRIGRLLQRTLRLDVEAAESSAKPDGYGCILEATGTIVGRVLAVGPNVSNQGEAGSALINNWIHSMAVEPSTRTHLLQGVLGLLRVLSRLSDESFGCVDYPQFSICPGESSRANPALAVTYFPGMERGTPIKRKSPSVPTNALFWFAHSRGSVGVSDVHVEEGDLVCHCSGITPTYALILRESSPGLQVMGRAIISPAPFKSSGFSHPQENLGEKMVDGQRVDDATHKYIEDW